MTDDKNELIVTCYVNDDGQTTLKCPNCDMRKRIDVTKHVFSPKPFKATCKCEQNLVANSSFAPIFASKFVLPDIISIR